MGARGGRSSALTKAVQRHPGRSRTVGNGLMMGAVERWLANAVRPIADREGRTIPLRWWGNAAALPMIRRPASAAKQGPTQPVAFGRSGRAWALGVRQVPNDERTYDARP